MGAIEEFNDPSIFDPYHLRIVTAVDLQLIGINNSLQHILTRNFNLNHALLPGLKVFEPLPMIEQQASDAVKKYKPDQQQPNPAMKFSPK